MTDAFGGRPAEGLFGARTRRSKRETSYSFGQRVMERIASDADVAEATTQRGSFGTPNCICSDSHPLTERTHVTDSTAWSVTFVRLSVDSSVAPWCSMCVAHVVTGGNSAT